MTVVVTEATREEFGLWYEEQAGTPVRRLLCAFAARVGTVRPTGFAAMAGVLHRVLERHPECRSTFDADEHGRLVKTSGQAAEDVVVFGSEYTVADAVGALAAEPLSATTGPVLRLGVRVDRAGTVDHVAGVAHHVVWDGVSEELFWAALADEHATGGPDPGPFRWYQGPGHSPGQEPDPHWQVTVPGRVWDDARDRAREHGLTVFSWLVGHLAAGVAAWSDRPVTPYVDVDLRTVRRAARHRIGYFQAQRRLGTVEAGAAGPAAARRVLDDIVDMALAPGGLTPDRELPSSGAQVCKFYLRRPRAADRYPALTPVDVAVPVARNDLAVGLTATGTRTHLTVTARDTGPGHGDLGGFGRHLLDVLTGATARGDSRGDEKR